MNVYFIDKNGTSGVIQNDLSVKAEEPVSEEVHSFLEKANSSYEEQPVTVTMLTPGFLIEFYVHTSARKVEVVSTGSESEEGIPSGTDLHL